MGQTCLPHNFKIEVIYMKKFISAFIALITIASLASFNVFSATYFQYDNFVFESYSNKTCSVVEYVGSENDLVVPDVLIDDTVVSLAYGAFMYNLVIESVTLPDTLTSIDNAAFTRAYNLISVNIPKNCTTVGSSVFQHCTSLKNVVFESNLTTISSQMFFGCTSLEEIALPSSVETIDKFAFRNCTSLRSITIPRATTHIEPNAFMYCTDFVIRGYEGSYAQTYAEENNIPFVVIDDADTSELEKALASAEDILSDDNSPYSEESLENLRNAVSAGQGVLADAYASQKDVDNATAEIQKAMQNLVIAVSDYVYGDADLNGSVEIDDVTYIQRYLASYCDFSSIEYVAADTNHDGYISIDDATAIQRYLAGFESDFIGHKIPVNEIQSK